MGPKLPILDDLVFQIFKVLNSSFYKTLRHDVCQPAIENYEEIFWVLAANKIGAQKLPIFDHFVTQW